MDIDSFFASVDVREKPGLKGLPVVVSSDPKEVFERRVVSACSYDAQKYGIHPSMPISQAYRSCLHSVFLPVNMKFYAAVSSGVIEILREFTEKFQRVGVDEAYRMIESISQGINN